MGEGLELKTGKDGRFLMRLNSEVQGDRPGSGVEELVGKGERPRVTSGCLPRNQFTSQLLHPPRSTGRISYHTTGEAHARPDCGLDVNDVFSKS